MKTIASFTVNHDKLEKGMYVSRVDGDVITYDIRMKKPNMGDYLNNGQLHTFEHLFATYASRGLLEDLTDKIPGPLQDGVEDPVGAAAVIAQVDKKTVIVPG